MLPSFTIFLAFVSSLFKLYENSEQRTVHLNTKKHSRYLACRAASVFGNRSFRFVIRIRICRDLSLRWKIKAHQCGKSTRKCPDVCASLFSWNLRKETGLFSTRSNMNQVQFCHLGLVVFAQFYGKRNVDQTFNFMATVVSSATKAYFFARLVLAFRIPTGEDLRYFFLDGR